MDLDVNEVLLRPNIIRAKEVVRNGFMSNLLFKNIGNIFRAPQEIRDILNSLPIEKGKKSVQEDQPIQEQGPMVDENGKVDIPNQVIIEKGHNIFGSKIFANLDPSDPRTAEDIADDIFALEDEIQPRYGETLDLNKKQVNKDIGKIKNNLVEMIEEVRENHINNIRIQEENHEKKLREIDKNKEKDLVKAQDQATRLKVEEEYKEQVAKAEKEKEDFKTKAKEDYNRKISEESQEIFKDAIGSRIEEKEKKKINKEEADVRDRLRGFTRTIPSALMAYGTRDTTIDTFEDNIDEKTFLELTSISKNAFRKLRDGWYRQDERGNYILDGQGNKLKTDGFFNKTVFNASVQEFFDKKDELSDYWQADKNRTIFDYIPLQETNQKFTPVKFVRMMVEALEKENPGIFSNPDLRFLDPYAKSGLFVTEIGRRLFEGLRHIIPDEEERLKHIFEKQVFALAPTEIIYNIAKAHIYEGLENISDNNLVKYDLTEAAKEGQMKESLNKIFGRGEEVKFDVIIGNPPYQEETIGDNKTYSPPIYHEFMEEAYKIAKKVIFITPARFLFNAGSTPKSWNRKMLKDNHLKIVYYSENASKVFPNTDIKGGIAITMRDSEIFFGKIDIFIPNKTMKKILYKVLNGKFESFGDLVYARTIYRFSEELHIDFPEAESMLSFGHKYDISSNIFNRLPQIFEVEKKKDNYIKIYGRKNNKRIFKWFRSDYLIKPENFNYYKVIVPTANGSGEFGEALSDPFISKPREANTETFINIGKFEDLNEAKNTLKYIKTKFTRALLSTLKVTQTNTQAVWRNIPLQDFTENSDIDWIKSIADIDQQLYKKYGLTEEEVNFIEENVQEMV